MPSGEHPTRGGSEKHNDKRMETREVSATTAILTSIADRLPNSRRIFVITQSLTIVMAVHTAHSETAETTHSEAAAHRYPLSPCWSRRVTKTWSRFARWEISRRSY